MPYSPDRRHSRRYSDGRPSPLLLKSMSLVTFRRIPTPSYAPIAIQYAEPSLRLGLIVPLALMSPSSRCAHQHAYHTPPSLMAPTPTAPPLSSSLRHDTLFDFDSMQSASAIDKDASDLTTLDSSETITRSSLYIVPQSCYSPSSKSGQTRYGNIDESSLDCVGFSGRSEKEEGYLSVAQIVDGATHACLNGVYEPVLQFHGTNITLHVLVSHFQHFLSFAHAHRSIRSGLIIHRGPP